MISSWRVLAALLVALVAAPLVLPEFYVTMLDYIGLATLVVLGLVVMTGVAGIVSFGQQAFVGIAAYTTAGLTTLAGWSPWAGLVASLACVAACALLIGLVTLRLSGHYLSIATIAWGIAIYYLFGNLPQLGQYSGIDNLPAVSVAGFAFDSGRKSYVLIWAVTAAALLAARNLLDSRSGRAIRALRFRSVMAESCGVDTSALKLVVFVYAALLAGLAGWLHAHYLRFVSPHAFGVNAGIDYLFMAVIGGASSVWGAVVGATIMTVLKEWLKDLLPTAVPAHRQLRDHRLRRADAADVASHARRHRAGARALVAGARRASAARRRSRASAARTPRRGHAAAAGAGAAEALRRPGRREGSVLLAHGRRDPRSHRSERRGQEHGVQPRQRDARAPAVARCICSASGSTACRRVRSPDGALRAASSMSIWSRG